MAEFGYDPAFASEIERSLLPNFEMFADTFSVEFDRSKVAALQDDRNDLFTRANVEVSGGWLTVAQAKLMAGLVRDEADDVYLRSPAVVEVPRGMTTVGARIENKEIANWAMMYAKGGVRRIK